LSWEGVSIDKNGTDLFSLINPL